MGFQSLKPPEIVTFSHLGQLVADLISTHHLKELFNHTLQETNLTAVSWILSPESALNTSVLHFILM